MKAIIQAMYYHVFLVTIATLTAFLLMTTSIHVKKKNSIVNWVGDIFLFMHQHRLGGLPLIKNVDQKYMLIQARQMGWEMHFR